MYRLLLPNGDLFAKTDSIIEALGEWTQNAKLAQIVNNKTGKAIRQRASLLPGEAQS